MVTTADIEGVFNDAKSHFQYASDIATYGKEEHWISPSEMQAQFSQRGYIVGDCDDFASMCVMLARMRGAPARFVFCLTESKEAHLVCEIEGWILDNRHASVMRRDDLDYEWVSISGYAKGDPWHWIEK